MISCVARRHTAQHLKFGMARPKSTTSTANGDGKRRVLFWTRTDLRTHDAPALRAALGLTTDPKEVTDKEQWDEAGIECFYPVWCWDPQYVRCMAITRPS